MAARLHIARQLYESNCSTFKGLDAEGNPLPTWESLVADLNRHAQVQMWVDAADRSIAAQPRKERQIVGGWG